MNIESRLDIEDLVQTYTSRACYITNQSYEDYKSPGLSELSHPINNIALSPPMINSSFLKCIRGGQSFI